MSLEATLYEKVFSDMLADTIWEEEDFDDLTGACISQVSDLKEVLMTDNEGLFIKFDNGVEVRVKVNAYVPPNVDNDEFRENVREWHDRHTTEGH